MPRALAVAQELLKSDLSDKEKLDTILDFDKVLGLNLDKAGEARELPAKVNELVEAREEARQQGNYQAADRLRAEIEKAGYAVEDTKEGMRVFKK